ncbi:hypothetical protein A9970_05525 [Sphingobacterium sp. UME9]|nr:hypothetical protein [Sphingobacterium sp. UME9]
MYQHQKQRQNQTKEGNVLRELRLSKFHALLEPNPVTGELFINTRAQAKLVSSKSSMFEME